MQLFPLRLVICAACGLTSFTDYEIVITKFYRCYDMTGTIPPWVGNLSELRTLSLGLNHLHGKIPPGIGLLTRLEQFDVGLNRLNGEVPPSIFNISSLQVLYLSANELSGTLPSSISEGIPNIEYLSLQTNHFIGEIPASISNLSNLNNLDLQLNLLSGKIPLHLGKFQQLERLLLAGNKFSNDLARPNEDFLTSLTNCRNLQWLYIDHNLISGSLPNSLGSSNLSESLERLSASNCRISGNIPSELGNLSNLIFLDLRNNELMGQIPMSFEAFTRIQWLSIGWNKLQGSFSPSLCNLKYLFHIDLSSNNLSGHLPSECFANLSSLQKIYVAKNSFTSIIPTTIWLSSYTLVMDMSENFFNGSIPPEIGNMKSLILLDLSGNQLSGSIPGTIGQLQNAIYMSFFKNKLQGVIPNSIADLKNLHFLNLSHNHINGSIPTSLVTLRYLEYFDVSFNELTGEIPEKGPFLNFTSENFKGNKGLCGASHFHVRPCGVKRSGSMRVLRYVIPTITFVVVISILVVLLLRKRYKKAPRLPMHNLSLGIEHERISYYEILHATSNLSEENLIGEGSLGKVYRGTFSDTMTAAVKVFNLQVQGAFESFDRECLILRSIRHKNLVKVITSCSNPDFKALIMEYMPNGNLERWLHQGDRFLNVKERLRMMIDVANALEYLHHGYSSPIVHCDLKPSNILLDEDMVAYVSDFGISKLLTKDQLLTHTESLGTIGYIAPEFGATGLVSTKTDVYSFGILLMEVFTRRKPTDSLFSAEMSMTLWVRKSFPDTTMQIVDRCMFYGERVEVNYEKCLTLIMGLALECATDSPDERIDMKDVAMRLKKIQTEIEQT